MEIQYEEERYFTRRPRLRLSINLWGEQLSTLDSAVHLVSIPSLHCISYIYRIIIIVIIIIIIIIISMPICTLHLLSLSVSVPRFLLELSSSPLKPLTIARVVRWIILPTTISTDKLLAQNIHWDILLTVPDTSPLPSDLQKFVKRQWSVQAGVPSRIVQDFKSKNKILLYPRPGGIPPLTGSLNKPRIASSAQSLELSPELQRWIEAFGKEEGTGAVSMLNLLSFKPGMKEEYLKYGAEFSKSIGSKRGGDAKIVGSVIHGREGTEEGDGWDEIALAHYPSIHHFADMLASEDYQTVNKRHRVGSLKDTFILCTTELGLDTTGLWTKGASKL